MENNHLIHGARWSRQLGAALVEMAIVVSLFCMLLFGIFEFALALFDWSRVVEATRAGARYAIVNNPEPGCAWDASTCPGASPVNCSLASGSPMLAEMQRIMPTLQPTNVGVTYACADVGFTRRPEPMQISQVTVKPTNIRHRFVVPDVLGLDAELTIPAFATTRVGEDLHTPVGP